jgi:hypothetical protein
MRLAELPIKQPHFDKVFEVVASALCVNATRNRNIIVVEQSVYEAIISDHIKATKVLPHEMGKAKDLVIGAHQIELAYH